MKARPFVLMPHFGWGSSLIVSLALLLALVPNGALLMAAQAQPASLAEPVPSKIRATPSLMFIQNVGQFADGARFQMRGGSGTLWVAEDALWVTVFEPRSGETKDPGSDDLSRLSSSAPQPRRGVNLKLSFVGADPHPRLEPFNRLDSHVSYFIGNAPANWHADVPVWGGLRYVDLYPGVDLEVTGERGRWAWRLVIRNSLFVISNVRLRVEGADALTLEPLPSPDGEGYRPSTYSGHLTTSVGDFTLPLLAVEGATPDDQPAIFDVQSATFDVTSPFSSPSLPPSPSARTTGASDLLYSMLLGGGASMTENDGGYAIAVDGAGSTYMMGHTYSASFPTAAGTFETNHNGDYDAFVVKVNAGGTELVYVVLLGGNSDDWGRAIAVDGAGSAYVAGTTDSSDFCTSAGSFDTNHSGDRDRDAFLVKVNADGTELAYATFLGGSDEDWGQAIAVDRAGSAYVTGFTQSSDFPITGEAFDTSYSGNRDAFVVKVNPAGTKLAYATLLGGNSEDEGHDVAVDGMGSAYVTGSTWSSDFPTTASAFDTRHNGGRDIFVVKVNVTGTGLAYATFLEGNSYGYFPHSQPRVPKWYTREAIQRFWSLRWRVFRLLQGLFRLPPQQEGNARGHDYGYAIAVDEAGNAYVTGSTQAPDFPTTREAFNDNHNGGYDAFVVKVNVMGTGLAYATFLGGISDDWGQDIAVDRTGSAYVVGGTRSSDLPATAGAFDASHNGNRDAFVVKVNAGGTGLAYATFLGGIGWDNGRAIAVDGVGSAYVAGVTESLDFPTFDTSYNGFWNAYVVKLAIESPFLDLPISYSNFARAALGNVGGKGPGGVNTWFDHTYPDYIQNKNLTRWDGSVSAFTVSSPSHIGESWYDGHNGVDFRQGTPNEQVFAAAPGTVIKTVTICRVGSKTCGHYYGNQVWVDHGNGYATLYAHLKTVSVTTTMVITDPISQPLGIMGNTGNSRGTHLHFGVYYDQNGDGQWTKSEAVDPYGWVGAGSDPWDVSSRYLWKYPLWVQQTIGSLGSSFASPSGNVSVTIPAGAIPSTMTVELWDMPPALESLAQLRSAGQSSWLRVLEWLTGDSITTTSTVLAQPITVGVTYRVTDVLHLDASQLTIHRWEKSDNVWTALSTIVDTNQNQATAQTTEIGRFDLQAPLLCPADSQEPDDHYDAAQTVPTDGTPVSRLFDIAEDEDWFRLEAEAGGKYIVRTRNLAAGVDTVVEIYDQDSLMLLALDRDSGGRGASYLMWQAPLDGTYFLRVARAAGSAYGCDAGYELGVKQVYWPSSVAIFGPTTGLLDNGYGFTAATSPITATQPITYVWQAPGQPPVTHVGGLSDVVTFTWRTTGAQVITVTATNVAGAAVGSHSIVIYTPARAAFTASPTFGQVPLTVAFTNLSTGDYTESLWDFGDGSTLLTTGGQTSTQESATHTYTKVGTYSVKLTVSGPGGRDTETKEAHITVVQRVHSIYLPLILR